MARVAGLFLTFGLAALYVIAAGLGSRMAEAGGLTGLVWPATGIALAALLLFGGRAWPGVLIGTFAANVFLRAPTGVALALAIASSLEAGLGAWGIRRLRPFDPSLSRVADVLALLVVGALLATTISATVGVAGLFLAGRVAQSLLGETWRTWWLGNVVADLTLAPLILVWVTGGRPRVTRKRALEIAAMGAAIALAALVAGLQGGPLEPVGRAYLFFPPLAWAVVRFGQRGGVTATFLVSAIAISGAAIEHVARGSPVPPETLFTMQVFLAVQASTFLLLGAALTERRRVREHRPEYLRALLAAAPDPMVVVRENGTIAMVNLQLLKAFGYEEDMLTGEPIEVLIPERFRGVHVQHRLRFVQKPSARPMGQGLQLYGRRRDGSEFPVEISLGPMESDEGLLITAAIRDLTERRRVEQMLWSSVAEKEVLLKEIHHRVRNSLQVISSLLSLQAQRTEDPALQALVAESQSRVQSIALVHEQLYLSPDLASIEIQEYLETLCRTLAGMYPDRCREVALLVSAEGIRLEVAAAIPCGLIITELVTNALRHGFTSDRPGHVWISLQRDDSSIVLEVADDGVGLPPGLDFREVRSVGLQLVARLVDQLRGTIAQIPGEGTRFQIRFQPAPRRGLDERLRFRGAGLDPLEAGSDPRR